MSKRLSIALVAHDAMKHDLAEWVAWNWAKLLSHRLICTGTTGHTEAVQITFDPEVFPYKDLVEVYWQQTDPTDPNGQFVDQGNSYRPAIFYHSDEQKEIR